MPGTQSTPRIDESQERMQSEPSRRSGSERQGSSPVREGQSTERQDGGAVRQGSSQGGSRQGSSRTAGTNRDFDESGESINQGHGHTRGDRSSQPLGNE